jgi:hypothetical protein
MSSQFVSYENFIEMIWSMPANRTTVERMPHLDRLLEPKKIVIGGNEYAPAYSLPSMAIFFGWSSMFGCGIGHTVVLFFAGIM